MQSEGCDQGVTFKDRQRVYFSGLLGHRWDCNEPGHVVCVPTEDGQHHQLSDEDFAKWVTALCLGEATTSQPPDGILTCRSPVGDLSTSMQAVSIPPSHRRNAKSPMLCTTSSLSGRLSSTPSSGVPGPGYYSGKGMKWIGRKCLNVIENAIIFKRCWQYQYRLRKWEASGGGAAAGKRKKQFFEMLGDMLELSRDCYSDRVRKRAVAIARQAETLTTKSAESVSTLSKDNALKLKKTCSLCLVFIYMAHYNATHDSELDFIYDLHDALTKVPLALQVTQVTSAVIHILGSQLLYSPTITRLTCDLGFHLSNVLSATLNFRALTVDEMQVILGLAMRRLERHDEISGTHCRPWEVAIVGMCSSGQPMLEDLIRGPSGISSLILALNTMLGMDICHTPGDYSHDIEDVLKAMAWLCIHDWIADIASHNVVALMLAVLRRQVRSLHSSFNALDILESILSHQPALLEYFMQLDGECILPDVVSCLKKQITAGDGEPAKYMANKSMQIVNKLHQAIRQGCSK